MSKRSECSIFLITDSEVVRADFSGKRNLKLLHFQKVARDVSLSSADSMQLVLGDKRKVGRQCFVFETSVWSQIVSVPRRSIEDIRPEELQNALKFEVETLSGVEAENSALGIFRLRDDDLSQASFWINVATSELFESVSQTLKAYGAKWVSLAHPAGFGTESGRGYQRIELWENVAVLVEKGVPQVIAGLTPLWQEQLGVDSSTDGKKQKSIFVQSEQLAGDELSDFRVLSLDDEETLKLWLTAAAARGQSDSVNSFPLVKTFDQVVTTSTLSTTFYRLLSVGMVSLFCFWHWNWLDGKQEHTAQEIVELEQPALDKRGFDQQLAQAVEQHSKLKQDANDAKLKMKKIEHLLDFQKGRLGELLAQLKRLRTEDLVIRKIELHESGIVVSGLALKSSSAPELANQLTSAVKPVGWNVDSASQVGKNQLKDGGPYEFSILLEDVGPGQRLGSPVKPEKISHNNPTKL